MKEKKLVIGGSFQGKLSFVCDQFHYSMDQVVSFEDFMQNGIQDLSVLYGFQRIMKSWIELEKNPDDLVELIVNDDNLKVIISDEIGCGIVPLEKEERYYREQTGRALCNIAKQVTEVYRVHCGLAYKIKG